MNGWAKIKTAAEYADVSERLIREWIKQGLKCARINRKTILINYSDLDKFIRQFEVGKNEMSVTFLRSGW